MKLLQHNHKEVVFFVRESKSLIEKGYSLIPNTWENYKIGKADKAICRTISVHTSPLNLDVLQNSYGYVECIRVPENYELTVDQINGKLNAKKEAGKSEIEKLKESNIKLQEKDAVRDEEMNAIKTQLADLTAQNNPDEPTKEDLYPILDNLEVEYKKSMSIVTLQKLIKENK